MSAQRSNLAKELSELDREILKMGGIVEKQIYEAVKSLIKQDVVLAEMIIKRDDEVDDLQYLIEDRCVKIIMCQQPVAKDLRSVFTGIKIVTDLERISDIAVNIARITKQLCNQQYIKPLIDIPKMAKIVQKILKLALDSYVQRDVKMAKDIFQLEEEIDYLYTQVFQDLLIIMMENPRTISQGTQLLLVGRHLERIGDHSTNIGEMVIYLETGERVKLND